MLRINLWKSLPINSTLCKRLVWCRRDHKVKFLVIALELQQPHVCLPLIYLRIAFSVWYFSWRTCSFSVLLFATAYLHSWVVNLLCDVRSHTPVTWLKKQTPCNRLNLYIFSSAFHSQVQIQLIVGLSLQSFIVCLEKPCLCCPSLLGLSESWDTAGQRSGISSTFCLACQVIRKILGKNKTRTRDLKEVPYCL